MHFTEIWAEALKQNQFLKILCLLFATSTAFVAMAAFKLSERTPLIVERGCFSKVVTLPKTSDVTPDEMEAFLKEAISYRFDSEASPAVDFLSTDEIENRNHEQSELSKKGITQMAVIHPKSIKVEGNQVKFDAERVLLVQNLRSTLPMNLVATISGSARSHNNPYGIKIEEIKDANPEKPKKGTAH